jgi:hypothetical protein
MGKNTRNGKNLQEKIRKPACTLWAAVEPKPLVRIGPAILFVARTPLRYARPDIASSD